MKKLLLFGGSIVVLFIIIGLIVGGGKSSGTGDSGPTLAKFEQVKNGMSISQVQKIMGSDGKVSVESGSGHEAMKMITWEASFGANCVISFQGGAVSAKAQVGLK